MDAGKDRAKAGAGAEQLFGGIAVRVEVPAELSSAALAGTFWGGFALGVLAVLALRWLTSRSCDRCDRS